MGSSSENGQSGVEGYMVKYVGHPPAFCATSILAVDLPKEVKAFNLAHPKPAAKPATHTTSTQPVASKRTKRGSFALYVCITVI